MSYAEAQEYVGTDRLSGLSQLRLLFAEGLDDRDASVLEIGCGTLNLARTLIGWLDTWRYSGIEPNGWLIDAALNETPELSDEIALRGAQFATCSDFRWPDARTFQVIFSHSVLSHASRTQLHEFMRAVREQLAPGGFALVSINIGAETTATDEWTYPLGVYFTEIDVYEAAGTAGLSVERRWEFTTMHTGVRPMETHDWIALRLAP